jgi:glyceraldehyde 3-phosphate dehydrogenase
MGRKVAINGFGRIGRLVLLAALKEGLDKDLDFVAVNDITDAPTLAHLFKYDSVHGIFPGEVRAEGSDLVINGKKIKVLAEKEPAKLPWKDLGAELVVESTGLFTSWEKAAQHLTAGAKKVIISAPAKGDAPEYGTTIVIGVNEKTYDSKKHTVVSNASCTTNCLAPVVKVLHENFKVLKGLMTTIHSYTNDQKILDAPHKDLRRARSAAMSMIPTTTGAAKAVGLVMPELKGKLTGFSIRVPTPDVSVVDFVAVLEKNTTVEEINAALKKAAEGELKGILAYTDLPLVSIDFLGNSNSSIVDGLSTMVIDGNLVKVVSWYDNEWGYSCRTAELAKLMLK